MKSLSPTVWILLGLLIVASLGNHYNFKLDGELLSLVLLAMNVQHVPTAIAAVRSLVSPAEIAAEGSNGSQKV